MLISNKTVQHYPLDQPLHSRRFFAVHSTHGSLHIQQDALELLSATTLRHAEELQLKLLSLSPTVPQDFLFGLAMDHLFGENPQVHSIQIAPHRPVTRAEFYQTSLIWQKAKVSSPLPQESWTHTDGRSHPIRPRLTPGIQYRRYIPELKTHLSFRTIEIERDLDTFHQWHNQPRVADLWELNQSKGSLQKYLERGLNDSHQIPLILELNEESVGYFEVYWATEDRLGPYYDSDPYDRGFHFLIGEERFLGKERTAVALHAICHHLFLDEPRTSRIVAEPRADNQRVIKYVSVVPGWSFVKEFDFPHKRAALLECERHGFFAKAIL